MILDEDEFGWHSSDPTNPSFNIDDYTCSQCGQIYKSKSAMNYHRRWVCSDRFFQCIYCEYRGKRPYCYRKHMERRHPKEYRNMTTDQLVAHYK